MEKHIATWGFVFAGALFLFAGLAPIIGGNEMNTTFFVLGIVFLILGASVVKRSRSGQTNAK
jgi:hypothetical protein